MAAKIRWSPRAASQIEAICEYIGRDSEQYARVFAQRVMALVASIPRFPLSGRVVPEYPRDDL
jgi:plasmid stabilization system protein ParE